MRGGAPYFGGGEIRAESGAERVTRTLRSAYRGHSRQGISGGDMSMDQWLADNLIPWALAGVAFVGSYSHLVALGQTHGVHGALAYTTAGCVDAIVAMAARERQRDKRTRRRRQWGVTSWPVVVLCAGVTLTLAGNLAMAEHSPWGWVMAGVPAVALLLAISMIERRTGALHIEPEPPAPLVAAINGHNATPPQPLCHATIQPPLRDNGSSARGATQTRMRGHWDSEIAAGRIPTGAALNRAAGKHPNYSLGKRYAASWRAELDGASNHDGTTRAPATRSMDL
jgi:hypothetical protein